MASDDQLPRMLYTFSVIFTVLPAIVVTLRFQARRRKKNALLWDDWLILFALVSTTTTAILIVIGVAAGGGGRPLRRDALGNAIYDHKYVIFQRTMFGADLSQLLALGPTKISVLLLYRRIFGARGRRFNLVSMTLIVLVIMWTVAFFFTNTFQYYPVHTQWAQNPMDMRPSMELTRMFLSQSYADVALDIMIVSLPIPLIWKLQMDLQRKIGISCIFLLGALTVAASVARTVVQYGVAKEFDKHNPDVPYYLSPINYWPLIESALGIVGACLPLLRPIGQIYSLRNVYLVSSRVFSGLSRFNRSRENSSKGGSVADLRVDDEGSSKSDKWLRPYDISALQQTIDHETQIEALPLSDLGHKGASTEGIVVERSYEVDLDSDEIGIGIRNSKA